MSENCAINDCHKRELEARIRELEVELSKRPARTPQRQKEVETMHEMNLRLRGQIRELEADRDVAIAKAGDMWQGREEQRELAKKAEAARDCLEAELRVCYKLPFAMGHAVAQKLVAERDAIEAVTIERCAHVVETRVNTSNVPRLIRMIAADIRALKASTSAQPEIAVPPQ